MIISLSVVIFSLLYRNDTLSFNGLNLLFSNSFVIINKYDLNEEMVGKIESLSLRYNSNVICKIPFDRSIHDALMKGETIIDYGKGVAFDVISQLWKTIKKAIG